MNTYALDEFRLLAFLPILPSQDYGPLSTLEHSHLTGRASRQDKLQV